MPPTSNGPYSSTIRPPICGSFHKRVQSNTPGSSEPVYIGSGGGTISCEKIKQWEYIDLATLLDDHPTSNQGTLLNGQFMVVSSNSQKCRQAKAISDTLTWLQAFSIFTAVLMSSDFITKEEAADLAAHSYLIIQLSKDLSGLQWLKYDQSYWE